MCLQQHIAHERPCFLSLGLDGLALNDPCTWSMLTLVQKMDGVKTVTVSLEKKLAQIEVKAKSQVDAAQALPKLVEAIKDLGFEAEPHCA